MGSRWVNRRDVFFVIKLRVRVVQRVGFDGGVIKGRWAGFEDCADCWIKMAGVQSMPCEYYDDQIETRCAD